MSNTRTKIYFQQVRRWPEDSEEADKARLERVPARAREELPHLPDAHAAAFWTDLTPPGRRKSTVSALAHVNPPLGLPLSLPPVCSIFRTLTTAKTLNAKSCLLFAEV